MILRLLTTALTLVGLTVPVLGQGYNSTWDGSASQPPTSSTPPWNMTIGSSPSSPFFEGDSMVISTSAVSEYIYFDQLSPLVTSLPSLVMEFGMRFAGGSTAFSYLAGAGVGFEQSGQTNILWIGQDEIFLWAGSSVKGPAASVDTDNSLHIYRIEVDNGTVIRVYQDGLLVLNGSMFSAGATGARIWWGDGTSGASANSKWTFFRHNANGFANYLLEDWDSFNSCYYSYGENESSYNYGIVNGELRISKPGGGICCLTNGNVYTNYYLTGDFDISVKYRIVDYSSNCQFQINMFNHTQGNQYFANVQRGTASSFPGTYAMHSIAYGSCGDVGTSDLSGYLRWTRQGNVMTGWRKSPGGSWVGICAQPFTFDAILFALIAQNNGGTPALDVAYDSLIVYADSIVYPVPPADTDLDGRPDGCDNCATVPNANQLDSDADGIGDACDNCPAVAGLSQIDTDFDGVGDICDNCVLVPNANQLDGDNDHWGQVCDCQDSNPSVNPGAIEKCDGVDNNCDLAIDDPYFCGNSATPCEGVVIEPFAAHLPAVRAIAVSKGGEYGDYIYFTSEGDSIFRINPSGVWSYFGRTPVGSAYISQLIFDNTASRKYGGLLYAVGDKSVEPPPSQGGVYRVYPNGTSDTLMEGSLVPPFPGLLGLASGIIDDIGSFGNQMIVTDFEAEDYGFPSNFYSVAPNGSVSSWHNTILRGALALELDHFGNFGNNLLVTNEQLSPWWQGDNAIYKVQNNGSVSMLIPTQGFGTPYSIRVDAVGGFDGNLLAYYESGKIMAFDATGTEQWRADGPTITWNSMAQDYWGAFDYDMFVVSYADSAIYRLRPASFVNSDGDSIADACDNCDLIDNPSQADCDNDGIGDACDYLSGDADNNGIITISDAVFLINYIFSGGPAPCPMRNGDADCNTIITISDAVYLINYIFAGGPAPC